MFFGGRKVRPAGVWPGTDNLRAAERGFLCQSEVFGALEKLAIFITPVVFLLPSSSPSSREWEVTKKKKSLCLLGAQWWLMAKRGVVSSLSVLL